MINNLSITSPHLTTSGAYSTPYIGNNGQSAGTMRWNTSGQQIEVFDGSVWLSVNQNINIGMTTTAEAAILWATKKMQEEIDLNDKLEKYPALKHAYEQYKIIEALVYEEETSGT